MTTFVTTDEISERFDEFLRSPKAAMRWRSRAMAW
jgi:hypothetical protein